jgi:tetratricopeptide (TPR) repeat protein
MKSHAILGGVVLVSVLVAGCGTEPPYGTRSQEAIRAYAAGMDDFGKFYYADALKHFKDATAADSGFGIAWARIALIHFRTQNFDDARLAGEHAMREIGRATPREGFYIRLLHDFVRFQFDSAAAVADSLIEEYPDDKEAYVQRGILYEFQRDIERAIQSYTKASTLDPEYAQAMMMLGYAYSSIGEQEKALSYMQRYIELAPEAGDPRASYADLLVRVGRYEEALEQYRKALELQPDYWYAMQQIARVYGLMGRLRESEEYVKQYTALLPPTVNREVMNFVTQAGFSMARGRYGEAAEEYRQALRIEPQRGSAAYGLCEAYVKLEEPDSARLLLVGILAELERRNLVGTAAMLDYYLLRSRIAVVEDDLHSALVDCDSALTQATLLTRPYVYRQIAEIDLRKKEYESALTACEEALALNPNDPGPLLTLTRIYDAMGDARMTREIGSRLAAFWAKADADFVHVKELRRILGRVAAA